MNPLTLPIHPKIVHPRTGVPIQAIAFHPRTGMPVWPLMGGDGSEDDKNDWSKVFEGQTAEQVKAKLDAAASASSGSGGDDKWSKLFEGMTPDEVKEKLDRSRTWEDRAKDNKGKADIARTVLEVLGLSDKPVTADELKNQLGSTQGDLKSTKLENALLKTSGVSVGEGDTAKRVLVDAQALSDSRSFMDSIAGLDPADSEFRAKLDTAVGKFVTDNPRYQIDGSTTTTSRRPAPVPQQGQQSEGKKTGGVAAGADLFEQTRTKKTAASATSV